MNNRLSHDLSDFDDELIRVERIESKSKVVQCATDNELIELWLFTNKSQNSRDAYRRDIMYFLAFVSDKPLEQVSLGDLVHYKEALKGACRLSKRTVARRLLAVKSLLTFAYSTRYIPHNAGRLLKVSMPSIDITQRNLSECQALALINAADDERDRLLVRLLYKTGCRVSELISLRWSQVLDYGTGAGVLRVVGKGDKERNVLLSGSIWDELLAWRKGKPSDEWVFPSSKGHTHLHRSRVNRIINQLALKVGIKENVSPHWLRHAHVSHALDRGAPVHLVQNNVGHSDIRITQMYCHARPTEGSSQYLPD
jgi:integrase/recombinase XerD